MTVLARKQVGLLKLGFKTGPSQRGAVGASMDVVHHTPQMPKWSTFMLPQNRQK